MYACVRVSDLNPWEKGEGMRHDHRAVEGTQSKLLALWVAQVAFQSMIGMLYDDLFSS